MTRIYVNPASLILVVATILGGCWAYSRYLADREFARRAALEERERLREEHERALEYQEAREREAALRRAEERHVAAEQAAAERQYKLQESLAAERAARAERERIDREKREAEAERLRAEAAEKARIEREEAEREASAMAERDRDAAIADAEAALSEARAEITGLEERRTKSEAALRAARNRISGAEQSMKTALANARHWGSQQGVKYNPDQPWGSRYGQYAHGIRVVQDNSEQVLREKARYEAAKREKANMQALAREEENALREIARQSAKATKKRDAAMVVLGSIGLPFPEPSIQMTPAAPKARIMTITLKKGAVLKVTQAVDGGDVYSVKTVDGQFLLISKADVDKIPEELLPSR